MAGVKPKILIICDYYLPGFESGGAMRTLANLVDRLGDRFQFCIVTRDHDGKSNREPYTTVEIDNWNRVGRAQVFYLPKSRVRLGCIRKLIGEISPDVIYLNSFFSPLTAMTLVLRRFIAIPDIPVILAPEGELCPGGLRLKWWKKRVYINTVKALGLTRGLVWKAASQMENDDIARVFGAGSKVVIAPNMPPRSASADYVEKPTKVPGIAKVVFLSRFMRKKNINWVLEKLASVDGRIELDIWGAIEDREYKTEAEAILKALPENIKVRFRGPAAFEDVPAVLAQYHFFVLPTLGENFGHVFVEALAAGCPLIISDQTPWRRLDQKGIGWNVSLDDPQGWLDVIRKAVAMDQDTYSKMSAAASQFARVWLGDPEHEETNIEVFHTALAYPPGSPQSIDSATI
ncbi:MAG: glycosyltransferase family 4 protein [Pyrinomonadaceae bacterium]